MSRRSLPHGSSQAAWYGPQCLYGGACGVIVGIDCVGSILGVSTGGKLVGTSVRTSVGTSVGISVGISVEVSVGTNVASVTAF